MLASVSDQLTSTGGRSIHVPKNNEQGRFPGPRPMVIINDKMRDHKMDLIDKRAFRWWCCSHIVLALESGPSEECESGRQ